ncbi:MAG TPA: acyltransferase [Sphingomicrobium sp.]
MRFQSIQVLRALAVTMVVVFHFTSIEVLQAGVDLFFVISGFIMAHAMPDKTPASFLRARFHRIVPTYYAATALALTLLIFLPGRPLEWQRLIDSLLLTPNAPHYLPQAWTLIYELVFYTGCALYMVVGKRALLALPAAWLLAHFVTNGYVGIAASGLFLEFLLGVGIAKLPQKGGKTALMLSVACFAILSLTGVASLGPATIVINPLGFERLIEWGMPAALLLHGALCHERQLSRWRIPILFGNASYSIYLTHWAFIAFLEPGLWLLDTYTAMLFGLTFYFLVERPLTRLRLQLPLGWRRRLLPATDEA